MRKIRSIVTKRLKLVSLSTDCLHAFLDGDFERAGALGGFVVSPDCALLKESWIEHRLKMIEDDPDQHPWMYRAIVRKSDNVMVGNISFHHKAHDPTFSEFSPCAAELGYTIDLPYRRQGYAKESALAMMRWGTRRKVESFFLTISPDNAASLQLAEALEYTKISEMMDEIDGIEYVYTARAGRTQE